MTWHVISFNYCFVEVRGFEPRSEVKTNRSSTYIAHRFILIPDSWLSAKHPDRSQGFESSLVLP